jgi:hypothetical protein
MDHTRQPFMVHRCVCLSGKIISRSKIGLKSKSDCPKFAPVGRALASGHLELGASGPDRPKTTRRRERSARRYVRTRWKLRLVALHESARGPALHLPRCSNIPGAGGIADTPARWIGSGSPSPPTGPPRVPRPLAGCRAVGLGRMPENHALRAPWCEECCCLLFLALREDVLYKRAPVAILPMVVV